MILNSFLLHAESALERLGDSVEQQVAMIREATAADLPELGRMFDSYRKVHGARSRVSACAEFLAERLEHPDSKTFLACLDDRAVGFIQLHARYASLRLKRNWILADLFV